MHDDNDTPEPTSETPFRDAAIAMARDADAGHAIEKQLTIHGNDAQRAALFGALAKARGLFTTPNKSKEVEIRSAKGSYTFKYAPLSELLKATTPGLAANGLAVMQPLELGTGDDRQRGELTTMLMHAAGGYITFVASFRQAPDIKLIGGQSTYVARYAYQKLLILDGDDDHDEVGPDVVPPSGGKTAAKPPAARRGKRATPPSAPVPAPAPAKPAAAQSWSPKPADPPPTAKTKSESPPAAKPVEPAPPLPATPKPTDETPQRKPRGRRGKQPPPRAAELEAAQQDRAEAGETTEAQSREIGSLLQVWHKTQDKKMTSASVIALCKQVVRKIPDEFTTTDADNFIKWLRDNTPGEDG